MLRSVDCNEKFYFYCGTPQEEKSLCPINYFYHKGNIKITAILNLNKCKYNFQFYKSFGNQI